MTELAVPFLSNLQRNFAKGCLHSVYRVTGAHEPYLGHTLGGCVVTQRVGQGAMSVVYQARQQLTDRVVALKMMRLQLSTDPKNVRRFYREAKALSRLSHANLVSVYNVGAAASGQPFMIMDYISGRPLGDVLQREGPLAWQRVVNIFAQACDAMQHAHAHGIIHRDLKPDNIMLLDSSDGRDSVKVVDFGIVKLTDESQRLSQKLTQTGEVWGSPVYMSPEQCSGHELDPRTDIYSLGTVMYECLTGRQLFTGKRITEIIMKQLTQKPEPFKAVNPALVVPAWLESVVMRALEKEPSQRFASMAEMREAIRRGAQDAAAAPPAAKPLAVGEKSTVEQAKSQLQGKPTDPYIGQTLGSNYLVRGFIGEGGMSRVYRAVQKGVDRVVAIKIMRQELLGDQSYVKRFQREAKQLSRLSHPNLINVFDVGVTYLDAPYIIMEYLQGVSLHDWLLDHGAMELQRALPIFIQICDVMDYAHQQGIIHRDLKPHNIMLVEQGGRKDVVKVVDFGIVKLNEDIQAISQKLTASGEICGSPMYMSPEQILDEPLDGRADVYCLGVVMYELIAGRPLFSGKQITEVMNKHVNHQPPRFAQIRQDLHVPADLEAAVQKALEKRKERRYQSMGELKEVLMAIQKGLQSAGNVPVAPVSPEVAVSARGAQQREGRWKMVAIGALMAVVAAIAAVGGALTVVKLALPDHGQRAEPGMSHLNAGAAGAGQEQDGRPRSHADASSVSAGSNEPGTTSDTTAVKSVSRKTTRTRFDIGKELDVTEQAWLRKPKGEDLYRGLPKDSPPQQ